MNKEHIVRPPESRLLKSGRVTLSPGEEIGWHVTQDREELIVILKGTATLFTGSEQTVLNPGDARFVKEGVRHNVRNDSQGEVEYVYTVSLFEEPSE